MRVLQSEALVLGRMPYRETSYIVHLYTLDAGRVDTVISGVRKKKARVSAGTLQPGHLIEMQCSYTDPAKLQRMTQAKPLVIYKNLVRDIHKSSIALFVGELLKNTLKNPQSDEDLFVWIKNFFIYLDETRVSVANFPIYFMAELTLYLGIQPSLNPEEESPYFDLSSGVQTAQTPTHLHFIEGECSRVFSSFIELDLTDAHLVEMDAATRRAVLQAWIDYYRIHLDQFKELKSVEVLQTVLSK